MESLLPKNGLAANENKSIGSGDTCRRPNEVLKLLSLHGGEDAI